MTTAGYVGDGPRGSCPHRRNAKGPARCILASRTGRAPGPMLIVTTRPHRKDVVGVPGQERLGTSHLREGHTLARRHGPSGAQLTPL